MISQKSSVFAVKLIKFKKKSIVYLSAWKENIGNISTTIYVFCFIINISRCNGIYRIYMVIVYYIYIFVHVYLR